MIIKVNNSQLFAAPGKDAPDFHPSKMLLEHIRVIKVVRDIFALDCCEFTWRQATKTVHTLAASIST